MNLALPFLLHSVKFFLNLIKVFPNSILYLYKCLKKKKESLQPISVIINSLNIEYEVDF